MAGITEIFAPIAPGPAVNGQAFAATTAVTFPNPSRYVCATGSGTITVIMNAGTTLSFPVVAGQWLEISISGVPVGNAVAGVAFW